MTYWRELQSRITGSFSPFVEDIEYSIAQGGIDGDDVVFINDSGVTNGMAPW